MALDKKSLNYKIDRSLAMFADREDSGLNDMYDWMENAYRSYWTLPPNIAAADVEWVHRVTSTDPHDAIRATVRTLAAVTPKPTLYPTRNNPESRGVANKVERVLRWQFEQASERRSTATLSDIIYSCVMFDEAIVGVWSLDEQIKYLKQKGMDTSRLELAKTYGRFIIKPYSPRDAIVEYSDFMPERVLFREVMRATEVIDYWGDPDGEIAALMEEQAYKDHEWVTVYDYSEPGHRAVFCYLQDNISAYSSIKKEGAIELLNIETEYKFLPIAARIGGTGLAKEERYRRVPMLWSVYNSGQWETQNILETLIASEALAYSVSPRYAVENEYDADAPDIDFRDPARIVTLKKGQRLQDLRPPSLNDALMQLAQRNGDRIGKSTVPRSLQSSDYMTAESFSAMNLVSQSGVKSITPYKKLAESVLAEVFTIMLYWINHTGESFSTYVPKPVIQKDDYGRPIVETTVDELTIDGDSDFDVNNIYLKVDLTEDVPTDYVAKINAAGMLVERLHGSYREALDFIGWTDPETTLAMRDQEDEQFAKVEASAQRIVNATALDNMRAQEELQKQIQEVMQLAQQLQGLLAQAQAGAQGGPGGQVPGGPAPGGPGMPGDGMIAPDGTVPPGQQANFAAHRGVGGGPGQEGPFPSSNPANGDMSPHMAAPGVGLREEAQQVNGEVPQ